nr:MAG TPA: hypothetical protein [Caudoviricetes sp.]
MQHFLKKLFFFIIINQISIYISYQSSSIIKLIKTFSFYIIRKKVATTNELYIHIKATIYIIKIE